MFWSSIGVALFRGGVLLPLLNMAIVRHDGTRASRQRAFWRATIAWSPGLAFLIAVAIESAWLGAAALAAFGVGAIAGVLTPERGIPDRLVGTWLVPR